MKGIKAKKSDLLEDEVAILAAIGEEFYPLLKSRGGSLQSPRERLTQIDNCRGFADLNKYRGAFVYFRSEPTADVKSLLSEQSIEIAIIPEITTSPAEQIRSLGNIEKARNGLSLVDRIKIAQDAL